MARTGLAAEAADALDAWYDESAQFDAGSLAALLKDAGFREIAVTVTTIWGEPMLLAQAAKTV